MSRPVFSIRAGHPAPCKFRIVIRRALMFDALRMSMAAHFQNARWLRSLRTKIALAMAVVALTTAVAFVIQDLHFGRTRALKDFQTFVRGVAGTTALALDGDSLRRIRTNADAASPEFQRTRTVLERARAVNGLREEEIYIMRPVRGAEEMEFVVMVQAKTFVGDRYQVPAENQAALLQAWTTGIPSSTGLYRDVHGQWISGYAPILGSDGTPVAIIETDAEVSRYYSELMRHLWISLVLAGAAFLVGMLPGLWLARGITRGLDLLASGMRRFRAGETKVQVPSDSNDEIGMLGEAFNEMIGSLQEKLALLPYVSRLTAEAVRRGRTEPGWLEGMEQDVMVLFADIRGFTRFCQEREAQELVRELNQLLSVQADVVLSAGGDVDKFIGDAIMAVFLDAADTPEQVYACARKLIERMQGEMPRHGWPLALGIGIHRGRAVVGSIGSEQRRDFTAIGHTVNLAARLCSKAGPWEILCSGDFHRALGAGSQAAFAPTEPMQFKNVQAPVNAFSCQVEAAKV